MPTQTKIIMREWNIFKDVHGNLAVAKQAAGSHSIFVAGPYTWEEAANYMRAHGAPGW